MTSRASSMPSAARAQAEELATMAPDLALRAPARLLSLLGSDEPLSVVLDALAHYVESWVADLRCSILIADADRQVLRVGAAPNLPESYLRAVAAVPIAEGAGSCGTAAARRETVIVSDVDTSPLWSEYRPAAAAHGLRACWSVPFMDEAGDVLGTFAVYYTAPREPFAEELALINFAAALARTVLLRHRDQEDHRRQERRLRVISRACADALLVHRNGRLVFVNPAAARLLALDGVSGRVDYPLSQFLDPHGHMNVEQLRSGQRLARLHRADGSTIPVEIVAAEDPADEEGSVVLTCRDLRQEIAEEQAALEAAEQDRERIGHDLHEGICQQLAGVDFLLAAAIASPEMRTTESLREVQRGLETVLRDAFVLASYLRPAVRQRADGGGIP